MKNLCTPRYKLPDPHKGYELALKSNHKVLSPNVIETGDFVFRKFPFSLALTQKDIGSKTTLCYKDPRHLLAANYVLHEKLRSEGMIVPDIRDGYTESAAYFVTSKLPIKPVYDEDGEVINPPLAIQGLTIMKNVLETVRCNGAGWLPLDFYPQNVTSITLTGKKSRPVWIDHDPYVAGCRLDPINNGPFIDIEISRIDKLIFQAQRLI